VPPKSELVEKTRHTKEGANATSEAARGRRFGHPFPWPHTVTSTVVGEPATGSQKPGLGKSARLGHPCPRIFTTGATL